MCIELSKDKNPQRSPLARVVVHHPHTHPQPGGLIIDPGEDVEGPSDMWTPSSHGDEQTLLTWDRPEAWCLVSFVWLRGWQSEGILVSVLHGPNICSLLAGATQVFHLSFPVSFSCLHFPLISACPVHTSKAVSCQVKIELAGSASAMEEQRLPDLLSVAKAQTGV